ncbi:hypothetical protein JW964_13255 [candidate division KSB1 bacterium]|nr:hypothetical protein [candidate division KSB1 bacterium]
MNKLFILFIILPFLYLACDEKIPTVPENLDPQIKKIEIPDSMYVKSSRLYVMHVEVFDEQGVENIALVSAAIIEIQSNRVIQTDTLLDNGTDGDIIPGDGVFSKIINPAFAAGKGGSYQFETRAVDQENHSASQVVSPIVIFDQAENLSPQISQAVVPENIYLTDSTLQFISIKVSDPQGLADIQEVFCQIFNPQEPANPNVVVNLQDAGQDGDAAAGDGIYSALISIDFTQNKVGTFSFRFQARDKAKNLSSPLVKTSKVANYLNVPPTISSLEAPAELTLSTLDVVTATMTVEVDDPQGLTDIQFVYFNSTKPDGKPAAGNPFYLNDDGNQPTSGDKVKGDGIYSITINLPPGTAKGEYTFVFEAVDFSRAKSNQITHKLTVK